MRTTIDIPGDLIKDAMQISRVKTKTMAVILGLKELINSHKLQQLRAIRGQVAIMTNLRTTRKR